MGKDVLTSGDLLEGYMVAVFQKTLPEDFSKWGVVPDALAQEGFSLRMSNSFVNDQRRRKGKDAVNDKAYDFVNALTRVALLRNAVEKYPRNATARKIAAFFRETTGNELGELVPTGGDSPELAKAKVECLAECVAAAFGCMRGFESKSLPELYATIAEAVNGHSVPPRHPLRSTVDDSTAWFKRTFEEKRKPLSGRGDAFSLRDVYVSPDFCIPGKDGAALRPDASLEDFVFRFAENALGETGGEWNGDVAVIIGGAGSGKSSLVAALANRFVSDFIPLGKKRCYCLRLSVASDTRFYESREPLSALREKMGIGKQGFDDALVILDGLDELCMMASDSLNADALCDDICSDVKNYANCHVVITSRDGYASFCCGAMPVFLQPYSATKMRRLISNFCIATNSPLEEGVAASLIGKRDGHTFVANPLLLTTVLSLGLDIEGIEERAQLYDAIFEQCARQSYKGSSGASTHSGFDAKAVARAFALEMRRKNRSFLTVREAAPLLEAIDAEMGTSARDELLHRSFGLTVYRSANADGTAAVEFVHRSFADFLSAEAYCELLSDTMEPGLRKGYLPHQTDLAYLLGSGEVDEDVVAFFGYFANERDSNANAIRDKAADWLGNRYFSPDGARLQALEFDSCFFINFWKLFKSLRPEEPLMPKDTDKARMAARHIKKALPFTRAGLDLRGERFEGDDVGFCDFSDCDLRRTRFMGRIEHASFRNADLSGAVFAAATLDFCDFRGARLSGTDFSDAEFAFCCFRETDGFSAEDGDPVIIDKARTGIFEEAGLGFPTTSTVVDDGGKSRRISPPGNRDEAFGRFAEGRRFVIARDTSTVEYHKIAFADYRP